MAGDTMTLKSSDDQIFEVKSSVATVILQNVFEDLDIAQPVFLPNVTGRILSKLIEYLNFHDDVNNRAESLESVPQIDVQEWDRQFLQFDHSTLFDCILAANYLNIKGLLDLTCQKVADQMKGKTPEQIRFHFNIKPQETTFEEEEEILSERAIE